MSGIIGIPVKANLKLLDMTSSEIVEEILHEAHRLGVADKVFEISRKLMNQGMDVIKSYESALEEIAGIDHIYHSPGLD
jgi:hypothetical protein